MNAATMGVRHVLEKFPIVGTHRLVAYNCDGEAAAAAACRLMLLLMQKAIMKHRLIQGNEVNCSAEL
jgi:hypothetical protein